MLKNKILYGIILVLLIILIIFVNLVKVIDVTNLTLQNITNWANNNRINLLMRYEYSNDFDKGKVIKSGNRTNDFLIKGISNLELVVSKGSDPNEIINIPNLKKMNYQQLNEWLVKYKLDNIEIINRKSNKYPLNRVIKYEINSWPYYRKDKLKIVVSSNQTKKIKMIDFLGVSINKVRDWAKENNIKLDISYVTSNKVSKNSVVYQSIQENKYLNANSTLKISISLGKYVYVKDYRNIKAEMIDEEDLQIKVKYDYDMKVGYGKLIRQSIRANSYVQANSKLVLEYSIGKPFINNLKGFNKKEVEKYFYELNVKKARLKYRFYYKDREDKDLKNLVVDASHINEYANVNQTIRLYLAK